MKEVIGSLVIGSFKKDYEFLSNFYPCVITYEDIEYTSVEHAFQAAKTLSIAAKIEIAKLSTPQKAKTAGRKVILRPDWEEVKYQIMYELLWLKFKKNPLRLSLLATEDAYLVEGNWWHDNTYGNCTCSSCSDTPGLNVLGRLLMQVRTELLCRDILKRSYKRLKLNPQIELRKKII